MTKQYELGLDVPGPEKRDLPTHAPIRDKDLVVGQVPVPLAGSGLEATVIAFDRAVRALRGSR